MAGAAAGAWVGVWAGAGDVPEVAAGAAGFAPAAAVCDALGLSQQECTLALRLGGDFGSITLPWRTTQRNADWIWGPGQPKRS